ncbi:aquaporin-10-like [Dermacentor andersoni]|uniref:aquaporin-10-like n=1 Tax=Dermacentor andersoni TaxID=34620 RepID=UPI00215523D5|nr:aquaporin-10-like [Dermacentor andersoni]
MKPNAVTRAWRRVCGCCIEKPLARQALAEMVGTLVLTLVGDCVLASLTVFQLGSTGLAAGPLGWGLAVFLGVLVAGGVSGAHLNPAVTVAMATVGKLAWCKVLAYVAAQYVGAFLASCLVYVVYTDALSQIDANLTTVYGINATAPVFSCFPAPGVSTFTCLVDQIVSTAVLLVGICAITDTRNMDVSRGQQPLLVGLTVSACMYAFSYNCGNPLNPARDLAPRIFTAMGGWGSAVFSFRAYNWFWVPVVGPHLGAVIGVWIYKLAVDNHWRADDEIDAAERKPLLGSPKLVA